MVRGTVHNSVWHNDLCRPLVSRKRENRMRLRPVESLSCAVIVFVMTGCGGGRDDALPDLVPVSGTITLDGRPASGVAVVFSPSDSTVGGVCHATSDENGHYELTDGQGDQGAQAGKFRVSCSKWVLPDGSDFKSETESPMEVGARQLLPAKYSDEGSSRLTATVSAGGGTIDFDLKSK